jgi:hypothetical protein
VSTNVDLPSIDEGRPSALTQLCSFPERRRLPHQLDRLTRARSTGVCGGISPKEPAPAGGLGLRPDDVHGKDRRPHQRSHDEARDRPTPCSLHLFPPLVVQNDNIEGKESRVCDAFVSKVR